MKRAMILAGLMAVLTAVPSTAQTVSFGGKKPCPAGSFPIWTADGKLDCSIVGPETLGGLAGQIRDLKTAQNPQKPKGPTGQGGNRGGSSQGGSKDNSKDPSNPDTPDGDKKGDADTKDQGMTGNGNAGYVPLWQASSKFRLGNSVIQQSGGGDVAIGSSPDNQGKLAVSGGSAVAAVYGIGGTAAAVRGVGTIGRGVEGRSDSSGGVVGFSKTGNGVTGVTQSEEAGAVVGIGHRAGLFQGNVGVKGEVVITGGTLTVDGPIVAKVVTSANKMFRIDHPLDPANKYLAHSSVESSEMMNIYTGDVTLDIKGEATIELPAWFEALNRDFRYQLTAIGEPGPNLYIAAKVSGNRFKIAGGPPHLEVSWQVTGVRHDAWAKTHPLQVEQEKTGTERGGYLHPEAFGQPYEEPVLLESQPQRQPGSTKW